MVSTVKILSALAGMMPDALMMFLITGSLNKMGAAVQRHNGELNNFEKYGYAVRAIGSTPLQQQQLSV